MVEKLKESLKSLKNIKGDLSEGTREHAIARDFLSQSKTKVDKILKNAEDAIWTEFMKWLKKDRPDAMRDIKRYFDSAALIALIKEK